MNTFEYIDRLEKKYDIRVEEGTIFSADNGWDPLIVKLTPNQLKNFIQRFQFDGNYNGVSYQVVDDGTVIFHGKRGMDIETML